MPFLEELYVKTFVVFYVVKHFEQEGFKRSMMYNITKCYEISVPIEHRSGAGRPLLFNRKNVRRLQNAAADRVSVSQ